MKKIYMAPQTEQVIIKSGQHLLDASMPIKGDEANTDGEGYYHSDARGGSWFDDDEEEDY